MTGMSAYEKTRGTGILMAVLLLSVSLAPVQAEPKGPDFTGVWGRDVHNYPKPYMSGGRNATIKDGYNNEYLKAWVVEALQRDDMVTRSGKTVVTQRETDAKDVQAKQHIAVIYATVKDEHILLTAVIEPASK